MSNSVNLPCDVITQIPFEDIMITELVGFFPEYTGTIINSTQEWSCFADEFRKYIGISGPNIIGDYFHARSFNVFSNNLMEVYNDEFFKHNVVVVAFISHKNGVVYAQIELSNNSDSYILDIEILDTYEEHITSEFVFIPISKKDYSGKALGVNVTLTGYVDVLW
jgi:hypothetical protein